MRPDNIPRQATRVKAPDSKATTPRKQHKNRTKRIAGVVILTVIVAGLGFIAGIQYQKSSSLDANDGRQANGRSGQNSAVNGGRVPAIGDVIAVNNSSVTVKPANGSEQTYKITNSTQITSAGVTMTAADIKINNRIVVQIDSSNTDVARIITILPVRNNAAGQTSQP